MVDASERGNVDGLTADGACGADSCGVFARAAVDDGVDGDLEGVLVGGDVYLWDWGKMRLVGGGIIGLMWLFLGKENRKAGHVGFGMR